MNPDFVGVFLLEIQTKNIAQAVNNAVESTHRLKFSYRMNRANRKLKKIYRKYGIPL